MKTIYTLYIHTCTRSILRKVLCLCCLLSLYLPVEAQWSFRIYDATGSEDLSHHAIQLVDTDNGKTMEELGLQLKPLSGSVKVYVTELKRGQKLMNNILHNVNTREISEFYTYYENHPRYVLHPDMDGIYTISEKLFTRDKADDLCIIVQKENMRAELFAVSVIDDYEGINGCPLYYTNRLKIQMTEKRMTRQINFETATLQLGDELVFPDILKIQGPENRRLVVERTIEMCTFDLDYNLLTTRQSGHYSAIRQLRRLLSHPELGAGDKWHAAPSVFVGSKFEKQLIRRMGGDVTRDSMMLFRENLPLTPEEHTLTGSLRWRMPNIDRYYRLRHTYYLQNFEQADTTSEACTCTRISPLRYFDLPEGIAQHDSIKELQRYYDALPFSQHREVANQLGATNLINFYVVNMCIAHEKLLESGKYTEPELREAFTACHDSLDALRALKDCNPNAQKYFEILTIIRYAEMTLPTDRADQLMQARELLTKLFISDKNMIAGCQGDRYLREIYRSSQMREKKMDIYLEAVEDYINWWSNNDEE